MESLSPREKPKCSWHAVDPAPPSWRPRKLGEGLELPNLSGLKIVRQTLLCFAQNLDRSLAVRE